jgi:hypothetical protein
MSSALRRRVERDVPAFATSGDATQVDGRVGCVRKYTAARYPARAGRAEPGQSGSEKEQSRRSGPHRLRRGRRGALENAFPGLWAMPRV